MIIMLGTFMSDLESLISDPLISELMSVPDDVWLRMRHQKIYKFICLQCAILSPGYCRGYAANNPFIAVSVPREKR